MSGDPCWPLCRAEEQERGPLGPPSALQFHIHWVCHTQSLEGANSYTHKGPNKIILDIAKF